MYYVKKKFFLDFNLSATTNLYQMHSMLPNDTICIMFVNFHCIFCSFKLFSKFPQCSVCFGSNNFNVQQVPNE